MDWDSEMQAVIEARMRRRPWPWTRASEGPERALSLARAAARAANQVLRNAGGNPMDPGSISATVILRAAAAAGTWE